MYIPDLTCLPATHPPSPYDFPLPLMRDGKWGIGLLPSGVELYAVGWLGNNVPHIGHVSDKCISALFNAYVNKAIFSDDMQGWHNCQLCSTTEEWYPDGKIGPIVHWQGQSLRLFGHGHYLVRYGKSVYIAPALILHYVLNHSYQPPDEFVQAVSQGDFLTYDDLIWKENHNE